MIKTAEFLLARDALKFLIKKYKISKMHIPYYLCDVVRHTLFEENCKPVFYHIDDNFFPIKKFPKNEFVLYPNYFGVCTKNVEMLVSDYSKIIVDNAHAYFNTPSGFAAFYAGHKFGFKNSSLYEYSDSIKDQILTTFNITAEDKKLALHIKNSFLELCNIYDKSNLLNIDKESIPFVYPYLAETTEQADALVKNLKKEGKTVYRYWNPLPHSFNEYKFYSRLVPIPVLP